MKYNNLIFLKTINNKNDVALIWLSVILNDVTLHLSHYYLIK